ncbi:MAG TPA: outer membrane protein assembly factor BamD [Thermoanaerobaculia bacterium]|jgi:outer membrane protein assembly factor BamD|nr:outer membrane protein assembly factor BamD [Thermoanaerobaculia bacterium]
MRTKLPARTRPVAILVLVPLIGLIAVTGCKSAGGGRSNDPILRLSAEESLVQGKDLLAHSKYSRARPLFTHAFEVEPNSKVGREALLLAADTYFLEGGSSNYTQAEAKYRDYLNRFPTSEQAAYVQFQIANSLAKRMEHPDRDQTVTRKGLEAYQELIRLYPTSEYATKAQEQLLVVSANLAEHEYVVGYFYLRYGAPLAAIQRFEYLIQNYPKYGALDKVMYNLGRAYQRIRKPEEAKKAFDRLRTEFPNSKLVKDIPMLRELPEGKALR